MVCVCLLCKYNVYSYGRDAYREEEYSSTEHLSHFFSSRGSFFASNILIFKIKFEDFEGVSTCMYLYEYILEFTCYLLMRVYLLYLLFTRRTTPLRKRLEECSVEEYSVK